MILLILAIVIALVLFCVLRALFVPVLVVFGSMWLYYSVVGWPGDKPVIQTASISAPALSDLQEKNYHCGWSPPPCRDVVTH